MSKLRNTVLKQQRERSYFSICRRRGSRYLQQSSLQQMMPSRAKQVSSESRGSLHCEHLRHAECHCRSTASKQYRSVIRAPHPPHRVGSAPLLAPPQMGAPGLAAVGPTASRSLSITAAACRTAPLLRSSQFAVSFGIYDYEQLAITLEPVLHTTNSLLQM